MQEQYLFFKHRMYENTSSSFFGSNLPCGDDEPLDWDLVKDAMWRRAMGEDSSDDDSSSDSSDYYGPDANLHPNHDG